MDPDVGLPSEGERASLSRRTFLKTAAVAAGAAGVVGTTATPAAAELVPPSSEELRELHADDPAALIDVTRCVGCAKCVRACKLDNELEWRQDQPSSGPDAGLGTVDAPGRLTRAKASWGPWQSSHSTWRVETTAGSPDWWTSEASATGWTDDFRKSVRTLADAGLPSWQVKQRFSSRSTCSLG